VEKKEEMKMETNKTLTFLNISGINCSNSGAGSTGGNPVVGTDEGSYRTMRYKIKIPKEDESKNPISTITKISI
jgi:hypothetical protein